MAGEPKLFKKTNGDEVWRIHVQYKGIRQHITRDTKRQCVLAAAALEEEIDSGRHAKGANPRRSMLQLIDKYEHEVAKFKRGYRAERVRFGAWRKCEVADWDLDDLQEAVDHPTKVSPIIGWMKRRLREIKPESVRREMTTMHAMFTTAMGSDWKWLRVHPMRDITLPPKGVPRDRLVTDEETNDLVYFLNYERGTVPQTGKAEVALAFLIALETMQRSSEILLNDPKHIHLDECYVHIPREIAKSGKPRDVPLLPEAVELYKLALQINPGGKHVFKITPETKSTLFRKTCRQIGIKNLRFHDSRRTAATKLSKILDPGELRLAGGWADFDIMYKVYYAKSASEIAETARQRMEANRVTSEAIKRMAIEGQREIEQSLAVRA